MAESDSQNSPPHTSLDELVEFFDSNDMGDYLERMPEAYFEVDIKRRMHLVAIDEELITGLNEIARMKQVPAEALVNLWLREKIFGHKEEEV